MSGVGKLAALAVTAALCAVVVRKQSPEIAMALALAAGAILLLSCTEEIRDILVLLDRLTELGGLTPAVVRPLVKVTGITVVTKLTAEICKDAKEGGIAGAVETAGTVLALVTAAPLLSAVLDTLAELL